MTRYEIIKSRLEESRRPMPAFRQETSGIPTASNFVRLCCLDKDVDLLTHAKDDITYLIDQLESVKHILELLPNCVKKQKGENNE